MKNSLINAWRHASIVIFGVVLTFALALTGAQGANILWVSDNGTDSTFSDAGSYADGGFVTILQNAGHTVTRYNGPNDQNTRLSASDLQQINTYDLVILGRAVTSTAFQNPQVIDWNVNVTKPLLTINAYLARAVRLGWCSGDTLPDGNPTTVTAVNLADPKTAYIFSRVGMTGSTTSLPYDEALYRNTSHIVQGPVAGGTILATANFTDLGGTVRNNTPVIMDWPAGTAVRGGVDILGGYRMYFAASTREQDGGAILVNCVENLTATGEAMFLAAVEIAANGGKVPAQAGPPTNVVAIRMDGQARISWSAVTSASSYNLKRANTSGGPYTLITNVNDLTHVDSGLVNGTTYYYVLSTVVAYGESSNSVEVSVTPGAAPANLSAVLSDGQSLLTWEPMAEAASYNIRRATLPGGSYTLLSSTVTSTNYVDGPLARGTRYYYTVSANLAGGGESAQTAAASVLTAPGTPQSVTAIANLPLVTIIGWSLVDPVVGSFNVEYSTDGITFNPLGSVPGSSYTFTNQTQPQALAYYRIQAINDTGASDYTPPLAVTSPVFGVNINFQLNTSSNFPGYEADLGAVYGPRNNGFTFGWDVANTANARQRNDARSPDFRYDTLNHMQKAGGGSVWEIEVPNGTYEIHVLTGDPGNPDIYAHTLAEGQTVMDGIPFRDGLSFWVNPTTNTVTVSDGRLTISNGPRAVNNKINYIDIIPTQPVAPVFLTEPASLTLLEARSATLSASLAAGTLPITYQWYAPGGPIVDATNATLVLTNLQMAQTGEYYVIAANATGMATSAPALVTVQQDNEAPQLISAQSFDGRTLMLRFSERVLAGIAGDYSSYFVTVGGAQVPAFQARLLADEVSVEVVMESPVSNVFVVRADFIADASPQFNFGQSYATGIVSGWVASDLGAPTISGKVFASQLDKFEITAGGADITGAADQGYFIGTNVTGNFDVRVRVTELTWSDNNARAGLMARASTNADAAFIFYHVVPESPGANRQIGTLRASGGATSAGWGTNTFPSGLPNAWLRLVRSGNEFLSFRSANGVNWQLNGRTTQTLSPSLLVGLATTSHNATNQTSAKYADFQFALPPVISVQPLSQATIQGGNVEFYVGAVGEDLTYQWRFNGTNLTGQTTPYLALDNIQDANLGVYDVIVGNLIGAVTSAPASLVIATPPVITVQPTLSLGTNGLTAYMRVTATGYQLGYQWYFGDSAVSNGTNSLLVLPNFQASQAGTYLVVVSNVMGAVTSAPASLIAVFPPSITTQPQSRTVQVGSNVTFTVAAAGDPPRTIRWRFNGAFLAGATQTSLTLTNVQLSHAGPYDVVVSNRYGLATSLVATLTVVVPSAPNPTSPQLVGGTFGASIPTETGKTYWLEYKNTLNDTNWTALPEQPGTGSPLTLSDPAATVPTRFYRVVERIP